MSTALSTRVVNPSLGTTTQWQVEYRWEDQTDWRRFSIPNDSIEEAREAMRHLTDRVADMPRHLRIVRITTIREVAE